jgi:hypothetical protein
VGCYTGGIDGDWGTGSRRALQRYFDAKDINPTATEPTTQLRTQLAAETGTICKPIVRPTPTPTPVADDDRQTPTTTTRPTTTVKPTFGGGAGVFR